MWKVPGTSQQGWSDGGTTNSQGQEALKKKQCQAQLEEEQNNETANNQLEKYKSSCQPSKDRLKGQDAGVGKNSDISDVIQVLVFPVALEIRIAQWEKPMDL